MKLNRDQRRGDFFNLSFLDVICCGFGAMVLLVLLSKVGDAGGAEDAGVVAALLTNLSGEQARQAAAERARQRLTEQTRKLEEEIKQAAAAIPDSSTLQQRIDALRARASELKAQTAAVPAPAPPTANTDEVKVGGIPVDSEHVIFIVDTSGSMQQIWERVIAELENVLDIHPQVKGFQIMNAKGEYLISGWGGRWIPDTPTRRKNVLSRMENWASGTSNPVEGLRRALRTYAKTTKKLAIYVFGDDHDERSAYGKDLDPVLDMVSKLNRDSKTGQPRARIHGIGFHQKSGVADRFATLMREVARQNRGAFIALGLEERSTIVESTKPNRN